MLPVKRIRAALLLSIVAFLIAGTNVPSPTYAATTITLTLTPPAPTTNDQVQFQGTITPSLDHSQQVTVTLSQGFGCTNSIVNLLGTTSGTGSSYSFSVTLGTGYLSGVGAGTYSAVAHIDKPSASSSCVNFTIRIASLPGDGM